MAYKAEMEGAVVMTAYNKRTYRIDDVDYTKDPTTKFLLRKEGKEVSYVEYYKTRYQVSQLRLDIILSIWLLDWTWGHFYTLMNMFPIEGICVLMYRFRASRDL